MRIPCRTVKSFSLAEEPFKASVKAVWLVVSRYPELRMVDQICLHIVAEPIRRFSLRECIDTVQGDLAVGRR